jgi:hypothetical protein
MKKQITEKLSIRLSFLIICGLVFVCSQVSFAATFTVVNIKDSGTGSLRKAIQDANLNPNSDTINFSTTLSGETISLTGDPLRITTNLIINGLGSNNLTVRRSSSTVNSNVFELSPNSITVSIKGLTVSNGYYGICNNERQQNLQNDSTLNLYDLAINDNHIGIINFGNLKMSWSLITQNGAGISINFNESSIFNTTITNNTGIGIILRNVPLIIVNSTISHNGNGAFGNLSGGIDNFDGLAYLRNTIVAQNGAISHMGILLPDATNVRSLGNNFIGFSNNLFNPQATDIVGTTVPIDPLLGDLQNNGGLNKTRALLTRSLAIDAGDNCVLLASCPDYNVTPMKLDQRGSGFPRLKGTVVDIGAFEK